MTEHWAEVEALREEVYVLRRKIEDAETDAANARASRDEFVGAAEELLRQIADPGYVGNYAPLEVIEIYRKWAKRAVAQPGEETL